MGKIFKITTYCTATYEYYVYSNSQEEAEKKHNLGYSKPNNNGMPTDVYDETIDKIEDISI
jgi:hypothetical protein